MLRIFQTTCARSRVGAAPSGAATDASRRRDDAMRMCNNNIWCGGNEKTAKRVYRRVNTSMQATSSLLDTQCSVNGWMQKMKPYIGEGGVVVVGIAIAGNVLLTTGLLPKGRAQKSRGGLRRLRRLQPNWVGANSKPRQH